jgi:class 3 adenylate cyclase
MRQQSQIWHYESQKETAAFISVTAILQQVCLSGSYAVLPVYAPRYSANQHVDNMKGKGRRPSTVLIELGERFRCTNQTVTDVLQHRLFMLVMSVLTVFALFGDDLRLAAFSKSADTGFYATSLVALILFAFEMMLNWVADAEYRLGFYFVLDFVATISLIPDIEWIWRYVVDDSAASDEVAEAGSSARTGTRAGRIVRIVRLVRMLRILKLYKQWEMSRGRRDSDEREREAEGAADIAGGTDDEPSKVGKQMSEMTTRKVIMLVLLLIVILPWFDGGIEEKMDHYQELGLEQLHRLPQDYNQSGGITRADFYTAFRDYVSNVQSSTADGILEGAGDWGGHGVVLHLHMNLCPTKHCPGNGSACYETGCEAAGRISWPQAQTNQWLKQMRFLTSDQPPSTTDTSPTNGWSYAANSRYILDKELLRKELRRRYEYTVVQVDGCYGHFDFDGPEVAPGGMVGRSSTTSGCKTLAYLDKRAACKMSATMNMFKTVLVSNFQVQQLFQVHLITNCRLALSALGSLPHQVMLVLGFGALTFNSITHTMVISPIERMMGTVKQLARNPLASTAVQDNLGNGMKAGYETVLLENTLAKIGSLMQVGFGAAGAEIIGQNMLSGTLNAMVPGKKITSIYGFCDIRQFTDTTECLQEDVMVYVNKLGALVHSGTHAYYGMANKNIGDAFLLSWKLCDDYLDGFARFDDTPDENARVAANASVVCPGQKGAGRVKRELSPTEMADSALSAFLKCCVDLENANRDGVLSEYKNHRAIIRRFGPDFSIKMGFGMHVGWAIEGAIGSAYKIDATYLSPHVEMSDRLEAGSKIFGVPINISHWLAALLSPAARKFLRPIDCIKVAGCTSPMTVFTYDVTSFAKDFGEPRFDEYGKQQPVDFENDPSYAQLQEGVTDDFTHVYIQGFKAYKDGDWALARQQLEGALQLKNGDGPSKALLKYMKTTKFQAPSSWAGVHELDDF